MKKILKLAVCLFMIMGVVACGGTSTEKQETVVKNFFDYLKAGDMKRFQQYVLMITVTLMIYFQSWKV